MHLIFNQKTLSIVKTTNTFDRWVALGYVVQNRAEIWVHLDRYLGRRNHHVNMIEVEWVQVGGVNFSGQFRSSDSIERSLLLISWTIVISSCTTT